MSKMEGSNVSTAVKPNHRVGIKGLQMVNSYKETLRSQSNTKLSPKTNSEHVFKDVKSKKFSIDIYNGSPDQSQSVK